MASGYSTPVRFLLLTTILNCVLYKAAFSYDYMDEAYDYGVDRLTEMQQTKTYYADRDNDQIPHSCRWSIGRLKYQPDHGQDMEYDAIIQLEACHQLLNLTGMSLDDVRYDKSLMINWRKKFPSCYNRKIAKLCSDAAYTKYRTADGSCNNENHPFWGKSFLPHKRLLPPMYGDPLNLGILPRTKRTNNSDEDLPSPRSITSVLFRDNLNEDKDDTLSIQVMNWGQFLDHDLTLTPTSKGEYDRDINCCDIGDGGFNASFAREECFAILIDPSTDPFFNKSDCMNFVRSAPAVSTDGTCLPSHREQINDITSYIDASNVYGSTQEKQNSLRDKEKNQGLLKVVGNDLPPKADDSICQIDDPYDGFHCLDTGDIRSNVVPHLGSSHILFVREHNRLAKKLAKCNSTWDDEKIFQEARRIVIAVIQKITYSEYLPKILGPTLMSRYKLRVGRRSHNKYDITVNPTISNVFGAAALRFGHTQIPPIQAFVGKNLKFDDIFPIEETFNRPDFLQRNKARDIDELKRWIVSNNGMKADRIFVEGVIDKLFLDAAGESLDLPALNIQRGRDHGIPPYNHWRKFCGLGVATSFDGLKDHTAENRKLLAKVYQDVNDIDLYAGAISEILVKGGQVGPTFGCILATQFKALKIGDSFWFERTLPDDISTRLTSAQIAEIRKMTLAKVMCENYDMRYIQPDVFKIPTCDYNPRIKCGWIPDIDLSAFGCDVRNTIDYDGDHDDDVDDGYYDEDDDDDDAYYNY